MKIPLTRRQKISIGFEAIHDGPEIPRTRDIYEKGKEIISPLWDIISMNSFVNIQERCVMYIIIYTELIEEEDYYDELLEGL